MRLLIQLKKERSELNLILTTLPNLIDSDFLDVPSLLNGQLVDAVARKVCWKEVEMDH